MPRRAGKGSVWAICIFSLLVIVGLIVGTSIVLNAPDNVSDETINVNDCLDLIESNDVGCDAAEDEEGPPLIVEDDALELEPSIIIGLDVNKQGIDDAILYKGVTLAGGEVSDGSDSGVNVPDDNDARLFIAKGMNTFRIPILWENIATMKGVIKRRSNYFNKLFDTVNALIADNATIVLALEKNEYGGPRDSTPTPNEYLAHVQRLWNSIAGEFRSPRMIFSLMNDVYPSFNTLRPGVINYLKAALTGLRRGEQEKAGGRQRLVILPGNTARIFGWIQEEDLKILKDLGDSRFAISLRRYFDPTNAGLYISGDCPAPPTGDRADINFEEFKKRIREFNMKVFVTETGIPDTPNCVANMKHFLAQLSSFPCATSTEPCAGVVGWTVSTGGKRWPGNTTTSLSPGGRANRLMWDPTLYEAYLTPLTKALPPFTESQKQLRRAIAIYNLSPSTLLYLDGYVPFQFIGSPDITPQQQGYLYSNTGYNTPSDNIRIRYLFSYNNNNKKAILTVGLFRENAADSFELRSSLLNLDGTPVLDYTLVKLPNCLIKAVGAGAQPTENRCLVLKRK